MKTRISMAFVTLSFFIGCATQRKAPVYVETTKKETTKILDTVILIDVPNEKVSTEISIVPKCPEIEAVPSDTSKVETSLATSLAWFDGYKLKHSIANKSEKSIAVSAKVPEKTIEIEKPIPYPVYIDKRVEVPTRKPLRWWEKYTMYAGIASIGFGCFKLITWIIKIKKRTIF